jgi:hypothetical protein
LLGYYQVFLDCERATEQAGKDEHISSMIPKTARFGELFKQHASSAYYLLYQVSRLETWMPNFGIHKDSMIVLLAVLNIYRNCLGMHSELFENYAVTVAEVYSFIEPELEVYLEGLREAYFWFLCDKPEDDRTVPDMAEAADKC